MFFLPCEWSVFFSSRSVLQLPGLRLTLCSCQSWSISLWCQVVRWEQSAVETRLAVSGFPTRVFVWALSDISLSFLLPSNFIISFLKQNVKTTFQCSSKNAFKMVTSLWRSFIFLGVTLWDSCYFCLLFNPFLYQLVALKIRVLL